jgi:DNA polymerase-3 subunit epsilon
MTGGQTALILGEEVAVQVDVSFETVAATVRPLAGLCIVRATADELAAHDRALAVIDKVSGGKTIWRRLIEEVETMRLAVSG